jgi:hypothetical protein
MSRLQILIIRTGATLGRGPGDDAVRILDAAGFAVHAVGCIDVQHFAARTVVDHLVHVRRTEAFARIAVFLHAACGGDRSIGDFEMHRLVKEREAPMVSKCLLTSSSRVETA